MDPGTFWPFYLQEHSDPRNRALHLAGTTLAAVGVVVAIFWTPWALVASVVGGYGFAWIGHFVFQHNRPATFRHPIQSLLSDWRMWGLWLSGRLEAELKRHEVLRPDDS